MAFSARQVFESVFAGKIQNPYLHLVYDLAHNMGKIETHLVDGKPGKVFVHRKGATRSFAPGSPGIPQRYQNWPAGPGTGQHGHLFLGSGRTPAGCKKASAQPVTVQGEYSAAARQNARSAGMNCADG